MDTRKPSEKMKALLMGRDKWNDADPSIRSWARLTIYHAAKTIIAAETKPQRRQMLAKIPATIRPHVEAEVKRLWSLKP